MRVDIKTNYLEEGEAKDAVVDYLGVVASEVEKNAKAECPVRTGAALPLNGYS